MIHVIMNKHFSILQNLEAVVFRAGYDFPKNLLNNCITEKVFITPNCFQFSNNTAFKKTKICFGIST